MYESDFERLVRANKEVDRLNDELEQLRTELAQARAEIEQKTKLLTQSGLIETWDEICRLRADNERKDTVLLNVSMVLRDNVFSDRGKVLLIKKEIENNRDSIELLSESQKETA